MLLPFLLFLIVLIGVAFAGWRALLALASLAPAPRTRGRKSHRLYSGPARAR